MAKLDSIGPEVEMPWLGHLVELRSRLLKSVGAIVLIFFGLTFCANTLYAWLAEPLLRHMPAGSQMIAIEAASPFLAPFKLALAMAVVIAVPYES